MESHNTEKWNRKLTFGELHWVKSTVKKSMHIQLRHWRSSKIRIRCSVYLPREQGRLLFEFPDHNILGLNHLILCASESYNLLSALTAYHCFGRQLTADQWETCAVRLSITETQRPHFPYYYQKLSRTVGGLNTSPVMCITFPHRPIHSFYISMYFSHTSSCF